MGTTTTPKNHPAHRYVLSADDQALATAAIAWRLSCATSRVAHVAMAPSPLDQVEMIGDALVEIARGVLTRPANVVVSRSLYLYGDFATDLGPATTAASIALADRLFNARMRIDRAAK